MIRLSSDIDLSEIYVKKRKDDGSFGSSQGLPFEIVKNELDNSTQAGPCRLITFAENQIPYEKELIRQPVDGVFRIHTTRDFNNHWANPGKLVARNGTGEVGQTSKQGPIQNAIRAAVLPRLGKRPGDKLEEKDWDELISLATETLAGFHLVKGTPERTTVVKGKQKVVKAVKEARLVVNNELLCIRFPSYREGSVHILPTTQLEQKAVCLKPDCLSYYCTTHTNPWCEIHVGPQIVAVAEYWVDGEDEGSIFSCVFSYGQEQNASKERKDELFNKFAGSARKALISVDEDYKVIRKRVFSNAEEAEAYLGLLQTTRLLAKIGGDTYKDKPYKILNGNSNQSLKMEDKMEDRLHTKHGLQLTCRSTTIYNCIIEHKLPPELGIRTQPDEKPNDGEGNIYFEWDSNVNYSGIKIRRNNRGDSTHKAMNTTVAKY